MGKFSKALEIIGVTPKDKDDEYEDFFEDEDDEDNGDIRPRSSSAHVDRGTERTRTNDRYSHTTAPAAAPRMSTPVAEPADDIEARRKRSRLSSIAGGASPKTMVIHAPVTYAESQNLVLQLRQNKQVIIKLDSVDKDVAQRILDFMSGAAFALECQVVKIAKGIYLFASTDTHIENPEELADQQQGEDSFYDVEDDGRN